MEWHSLYDLWPDHWPDRNIYYRKQIIMKTVKYIINNIYKMAEKDSFENGCDFTSSQTSLIDLKIESCSLSEVIEEFMSFVSCDDKKSVIIDSCDEDGRIDIQVTENGEGYTPSPYQIEQWKKGEFDLYAVTYTAQVEKHIVSSFNIAESLGEKSKEFASN